MENRVIPTWGLAAFCWIIAGYFLSGYFAKAGIPPTAPLGRTEAVNLATGLFFLFLPYFNRVKIGKLLELERNVEQAREEVKTLRDQVQANFAILTSNVSAIAAVKNTVNVYSVPTNAEREEAQEEITKVPAPTPSKEAEIKRQWLLEDEDTIMALARTRILLEQKLRRILGKRLKVSDVGSHSIRFQSVPMMTREFLKEYPKYQHLAGPIDYVNRACSAAIHGQTLPPNHAAEALHIGAKIIGILDELLGKDGEASEVVI